MSTLLGQLAWDSQEAFVKGPPGRGQRPTNFRGQTVMGCGPTRTHPYGAVWPDVFKRLQTLEVFGCRLLMAWMILRLKRRREYWQDVAGLTGPSGHIKHSKLGGVGNSPDVWRTRWRLQPFHKSFKS